MRPVPAPGLEPAATSAAVHDEVHALAAAAPTRDTTPWNDRVVGAFAPAPPLENLAPPAAPVAAPAAPPSPAARDAVVPEEPLVLGHAPTGRMLAALVRDAVPPPAPPRQPVPAPADLGTWPAEVRFELVPPPAPDPDAARAVAPATAALTGAAPSGSAPTGAALAGATQPAAVASAAVPLPTPPQVAPPLLPAGAPLLALPDPAVLAAVRAPLPRPQSGPRPAPATGMPGLGTRRHSPPPLSARQTARSMRIGGARPTGTPLVLPDPLPEGAKVDPAARGGPLALAVVPADGEATMRRSWKPTVDVQPIAARSDVLPAPLPSAAATSTSTTLVAALGGAGALVLALAVAQRAGVLG